MKTLILSCNTGGGHNSCAKSIKEIYDKNNIECVVKDALAFSSVTVSKVVSNTQTLLYRYFPRVFGSGYRYTEKNEKMFDKGSFWYRVITKGRKKLYEYIVKENFTNVICVHAFAALFLSDVMEHYQLKVKSSYVATDYTCCPSTKVSNLDYYFIPHITLRSAFLSEHITEEKIFGSGIPIRQAFYSSVEKTEAKKSLGISPLKKHVLLMCGSLGCGPMKKLVNLFFNKNDSDIELTVICGTNKRLTRKLTRRYAKTENIHIKGFVSNVPLLMDSADVYITKPGGLSVSEAFTKNLPLVLIDAVAGCEEYNGRFFVDLGVARIGRTAEEIFDSCMQLINDEEALSDARRIMQEIEKVNSSLFIYNTLAGADQSATDDHNSAEQ